MIFHNGLKMSQGLLASIVGSLIKKRVSLQVYGMH